MAKPWWDTPTSRQFGFKGIATICIAKRIAYIGWEATQCVRAHRANRR